MLVAKAHINIPRLVINPQIIVQSRGLMIPTIDPDVIPRNKTGNELMNRGIIVFPSPCGSKPE